MQQFISIFSCIGGLKLEIEKGFGLDTLIHPPKVTLWSAVSPPKVTLWPAVSWRKKPSIANVCVLFLFETPPRPALVCFHLLVWPVSEMVHVNKARRSDNVRVVAF